MQDMLNSAKAQNSQARQDSVAKETKKEVRKSGNELHSAKIKLLSSSRGMSSYTKQE